MAAPIDMLLLADIWEVLGALLALLVPVIWGIKQIADAAKQGQQPEKGAEPPRQAEAVAPRPAARPGEQADPLRSQVEEFLRRSGRAPQADRGQPARRDIEVLIDEESVPRRVAGEPVRPAAVRAPAAASAPPPTPAPTPPAANRPVRRSVIPKTRRTLAERAVERAAIRADKVAEMGSHLGQRIIQDDRQFDAQLKAKFDHTVGTLGGSSAAAAKQVPAPPDSPAGRIAAMLASPSGVRQAIVLNEIFNRPSDRW
jgi:hypothetical protein